MIQSRDGDDGANVYKMQHSKRTNYWWLRRVTGPGLRWTDLEHGGEGCTPRLGNQSHVVGSRNGNPEKSVET